MKVQGDEKHHHLTPSLAALRMQVIESVAAVHGCTVAFRWSDQAYGPTVNSREVVDIVQKAGAGLLGQERVTLLEEPTMAAEDFSFLAGGSRAAGCIDMQAELCIIACLLTGPT